MRPVSQKYPCKLPRSYSALICLFFIFSCSIPSINPKSETENQRSELSYYANGKLEYEAEYFKGKLDGMSRYWSIEGGLISESEYSNGNPHGMWKKYHINGNIMSEVNYFHGQKHGLETWYHENGEIQSEQTYNYGNPEGDLIRWDQDGSILY